MSNDDGRDLVAKGRRNFLRKTAALTGGALAAGGTARAAPLSVQPSSREPGHVIEETAYGMPSKFEAHVKRRRTDILKNRQNFSDWSMTPLQSSPASSRRTGLSSSGITPVRPTSIPRRTGS